MNRRSTVGITVVQLCLLLPVVAHGQGGENVFSPPEPQQQRQFCAVYQEDTARRNAYDAELAAAKTRAAGNPIAERQIHITQPEFESLFRTKQASVMGNGTFQNWVARVKIDLSGDRVFLSFDFPCKWTEYGYSPNMSDGPSPPSYSRSQTADTLSFGTAFPPRTGVLVDSELGNSLGKLRQNETVIASGRLFCVSPAAPPFPSRTGGCTRTQDGMLWATISSVRTVRGGTVWNFPNTRGEGISFNTTDDYSTLMQKARSSGASALGEYLSFVSIIYMAQPVGSSPRPAGSVFIRVQGDMPSVIGQARLQKPTPFVGKDNDCFVLKPEDQIALENRAKEIDRILASLFDTKLAEGAQAEPNACVDESGNPKLPPPPDSSTVYMIGNGVSAPVAIRRVDPEYSEEARRAKLAGTVTLSVVVDENGLAQDIKVVTGMGKGLDEKAVEAVRQWRFRPGMKNGRPVKTAATVKILFRLL